MLMLLGIDNRNVYEDDFEKHFLTQSSEFYRVESQSFLEVNCASAYIHKVKNSILKVKLGSSMIKSNMLYLK